MKRWKSVLIALAWLTAFATSASPLVAGKYNSERNIGDQPDAWVDLPGTDGKTHSLNELANFDVVVVVFTCNSCPYAVDYEERINALAAKFQGVTSRATVVAINVNKIEADLLPAMKKRSEERKLKYPYLYDETQKIAKAYGAVRTPEFFVLNKERRIVYMGAMDDNTKADQVKTKYIEDVVSATLDGKTPSITETPPVGCAIRYVRERKK